MADDANSLYEYSQAGIPAGFTSNLQSLGYTPQPFASQEQVFQNQGSFQQILKRILDAQLQGYDQYGVGPSNLSSLPFNMRGMYNQAALAFKDPMYGAIGNNAFFGGGYKLGDLPNNRSPAYETWWNAKNNYPNVPAPRPISAGGGGGGNQGGGGGGGGASPSLYTVNIIGPDGSPGTIEVVASGPGAAEENARQGNNQPISGSARRS